MTQVAGCPVCGAEGALVMLCSRAAGGTELFPVPSSSSDLTDIFKNYFIYLNEVADICQEHTEICT